MTDSLIDRVYNAAKAWTIEAGEQLTESLTKKVQVEYKTSAADLVTEMDRSIEQFFAQRIHTHFPDHCILGEEGTLQQEFDPEQEWVWIIDPIDGTTNFVHQKQNFSISIGIYEKGQPRVGLIYDPIRRECFHAIRGRGAYQNEQKLERLTPTKVEESIVGLNSLWLTPNDRFEHTRLQSLVRHLRASRSIGSAALEMAYVACGRIDGYISLRLSPWDIAAGLVLLEEVGARMTTVHNERIDHFSKTTLFVANAGLHQEITESFLLAEQPPAYKVEV